ncbi:MAG: hypothetical protein JWL99_6380 [Streptomyces oryziradicis]|nr:hypothetical protein [Actinacidiphila oryziradicis]
MDAGRTGLSVPKTRLRARPFPRLLSRRYLTRRSQPRHPPVMKRQWPRSDRVDGFGPVASQQARAVRGDDLVVAVNRRGRVLQTAGDLRVDGHRAVARTGRLGAPQLGVEGGVYAGEHRVVVGLHVRAVRPLLPGARRPLADLVPEARVALLVQRLHRHIDAADGGESVHLHRLGEVQRLGCLLQDRRGHRPVALIDTGVVEILGPGLMVYTGGTGQAPSSPRSQRRCRGPGPFPVPDAGAVAGTGPAAHDGSAGAAVAGPN